MYAPGLSFYYYSNTYNVCDKKYSSVKSVTAWNFQTKSFSYTTFFVIDVNSKLCLIAFKNDTAIGTLAYTTQVFSRT